MHLRQHNGPRVSAAKAAFSTATAYRIENDSQLPSTKKKPRGQRRPDPLAGIFDEEIVPMLEQAPDLRSVGIFEELIRRHPELGGGVRRTLEHRVRERRAARTGARARVPPNPSAGSARSVGLHRPVLIADLFPANSGWTHKARCFLARSVTTAPLPRDLESYPYQCRWTSFSHLTGSPCQRRSKRNAV